jgi:Zn-finger nucleic acid-binding protein
MINCPVCKTPELISTELESNLSSLQCPDCGGNWIQGARYWKWLETHGPNAPELPGQDGVLSLAGPERYIDCPECRFRMVKYLVGHGLSFALDHCEGCKGIWLDGNEWETLKKHNLHDDINSMLTYFWQAQARKASRKKALELDYIRRFGADDYAEIQRVRAWLETRQDKQGLLAYLTDDDPFDV